MSHWKKWIWPGILTVTILSLLTIWMKRDIIQNDLTAKATTALTANGQTWAIIEMDGRDAVLKGNAPSEEDRKQAVKIVDDVYDVRVVDDQTGLVAAQSPYILTAKRENGAVELTGFVPNEVVRGTMIDAAKELLPDTEVKDSLTIARGQPDNLESLASFGLMQLAGLKQGEFSLSDKTLSVKGVPKDRDSYDAIQSALAGKIPADGTLALNEITPPGASPYDWSANYNGETLTLGGVVPSRAGREAILAHAKSLLPDATIKDNQLLATGAPEGFEKAAEYALQQLPRFKSGKVGLSDLNMSISGVANSSKNYTVALNAIGADALPAGMTLANGTILAAIVSPYSWAVKHDGKSATLNGFVPDNSTRQSIIEKAKSSLGVFDVTDNMQIADGAPPKFSDKVDYMFQVLGALSGGETRLLDNNLSINGVARDVAAFETVNAIIGGNLPAGLKLSETSISSATVSPYQWATKYDGKILELNGFAPDENVRSEIVEMAKKILPDAEITNTMQIAAGAPAKLADIVGFSLGQLSRFSAGSITLRDLNISVAGVAKTVDDYQTSKQAVSGELALGMNLESEMITPPVVSPYSWGADRDGNVVSLTGFVPSEKARAQIIEKIQAAFSSAKIVDNMQIAAGEPAAYDAATASAIAILPKFSKGSVALSGINLTVSGTAKTSAHYLAAEGYVKNGFPDPVNVVLANIAPPAIEGAYNWQARKSGSHIVLSGHVPGKADRTKVAQTALKANPGSSVVNRLVFGTGAPQNFNPNIELGLSLLAGLKEGTAAIANENLSVNGVAGSVNSYEKLLAVMKDVNGEIQPPKISPYSWSVRNEADVVKLGGFVPSRGVGNTHVEASKAVLSKPIVDGQRVATGEPEGFSNAAAALIAGVERLVHDGYGYATITDTNALLRGKAKSGEEAKQIGESVKNSLPANFRYRYQISFPLPEPAPEIKLKEEFIPKPVLDAPKAVVKLAAVPKPVEVPKPTVCTIDFMALIDGEKIQFDTAEAVVHKSSYPLLDRIADGLRECQNSRIEVGGHTDARGDEQYNLELSEARAQAIVSYLTGQEGISADKLEAKGYGELHPITPNTDDERAANRRIEFKVLDQ